MSAGDFLSLYLSAIASDHAVVMSHMAAGMEQATSTSFQDIHQSHAVYTRHYHILALSSTLHIRMGQIVRPTRSAFLNQDRHQSIEYLSLILWENFCLLLLCNIKEHGWFSSTLCIMLRRCLHARWARNPAKRPSM